MSTTSLFGEFAGLGMFTVCLFFIFLSNVWGLVLLRKLIIKICMRPAHLSWNSSVLDISYIASEGSVRSNSSACVMWRGEMGVGWGDTDRINQGGAVTNRERRMLVSLEFVS